MSEPIDYKTVKTVKFNGSDIKKIMFNGVRVWERIETPIYTQEYQTSGYWQEYNTYVSDGYWANSTSYVSSGYWATGTRQVTVSSTCTRSVTKCLPWYWWFAWSSFTPWCWDEIETYQCNTVENVSYTYWVDTSKAVSTQYWVDKSYYKTDRRWIDTSGWVTRTTINTTYYP